MPKKDQSGLGRALQKAKINQKSSAKNHWENKVYEHQFLVDLVRQKRKTYNPLLKQIL